MLNLERTSVKVALAVRPVQFSTPPVTAVLLMNVVLTTFSWPNAMTAAPELAQSLLAVTSSTSNLQSRTLVDAQPASHVASIKHETFNP